jgi:hypothetical protein
MPGTVRLFFTDAWPGGAVESHNDGSANPSTGRFVMHRYFPIAAMTFGVVLTTIWIVMLAWLPMHVLASLVTDLLSAIVS